MVKTIQKRLTELGYAPGEPDGIHGLKTYNAIRKYQENNGLAIDGLPSRELLRKHLSKQ